MLETKKTLEAQEIQAILPHRYPMLMVDRVLDLKPGESVVAQRMFQLTNRFFRDTFLVIQFSLVCCRLKPWRRLARLHCFRCRTSKERQPTLAALKAKFRHMVRPGDVLRIEVTLEKLIDNAGLGKGKIYVGENMASSADLVLLLAENCH